MKKRSLKLLSLAMSGVLTFSSLSSMTAFAAPEDDFGDRLEEQFETEAEDEAVEDEEISLSVETEDIENVEVSVDELVPPVDVKWDAPGIFSFKVASDTPMYYGADVYRGEHIAYSAYIRDMSDHYGETITRHRCPFSISETLKK